MGGGNKSEHLLIILPVPEPKQAIERLEKRFSNLRVTFKSLLFEASPWKGVEEIDPEIYKDATILLTLSAVPPDEKYWQKLELIQLASAGSNHIQSHPIYTSTSIPISTASGIHGPQIAEWVILTALAHSHHYSLLHTWQQQHNWSTSPQDKLLLSSLRDKVGQRIGILGYGSIGRQVGRVAVAMGMSVIAYTAHPRSTPESKKDSGFIVPGTGDPDGTLPVAWFSGTSKSDLHHFLSQDLDHLLISVPLTAATTHLISGPELTILGSSRNTFISNISRGAIVDQEALIQSLRAYAANDPLKGGDGGGGIRGAALDVTEPEPLPKDSELWDTPNVIVTPHISGLGSRYFERVFGVLEENLGRKERGETLINIVDRKRGY